MNAETFLGQLYKIDNLIKSEKEELEELRTLATSISGDMTQERVQTSVSNDRMTDIISKIIDLENEIKNEMTAFINIKKEVRDVINKVQDVDEKLFLRYRYIHFYSWKAIGINMKYSQTQIQRIKESAIKSIEKILNVNEC